MGQRVHSGSSREKRGKADRDFGIQDGISGNKRKVVDGVFMPRFGVGNDGGQSRFAAGSGGRGDGDEKRQPFMYF